MLLNRVESRAAQEGYLELALDTAESATHLIDLYERLGFRIVDTHDWRPGTNYSSVIMSKSLRQAEGLTPKGSQALNEQLLDNQ